MTPLLVDEEDAVVDVLEHSCVPLQLQPLLVDLAVEPADLDRTLQRGDEVVAVDRLLDEVVRAAAQRLDGQVVLAVAGDQQGRRARDARCLISSRSARPSIPGILMSVTIAS